MIQTQYLLQSIGLCKSICNKNEWNDKCVLHGKVSLPHSSDKTNFT